MFPNVNFLICKIGLKAIAQNGTVSPSRLCGTQGLCCCHHSALGLLLSEPRCPAAPESSLGTEEDTHILPWIVRVPSQDTEALTAQPVKGTLLGNSIFAEVIKVKSHFIHRTAVLARTEELGHRE